MEMAKRSQKAMGKVITYLLTPRLIGSYILRHFMSTFFNDRTHITLEYLFEVGKKLPIESPKTFNEKLQWLKLNDIHPEYTQMVDKVAAKDYVASIIGEKYIIPTLGVWNYWEEIDFNKLPEKFVLKTTHDSGGVAVCKDKSGRTLREAKKKICKSLKHNYFYEHREYPYRNVPPKIIAEKYMVDESGFELKDYKVFCFNGVPRIVQVDYDRFVCHKRNLYDTEWNRLPFTLKFPTDWNVEFPRPENFDKMLEIASKLSQGVPFVRVDLYNINGDVYFGELTFFHGSGFEKFTPEEWDLKLGNWIKINVQNEDDKDLCSRTDNDDDGCSI